MKARICRWCYVQLTRLELLLTTMDFEIAGDGGNWRLRGYLRGRVDTLTKELNNATR